MLKNSQKCANVIKVWPLTSILFSNSTCIQIEFDEPKEAEPWYVNFRVPIDGSNGVYYGPYKTKRSLNENLLKWANAYLDKYETISDNCVGRQTLYAFAVVGLTLESIDEMPSYFKGSSYSESNIEILLPQTNQNAYR